MEYTVNILVALLYFNQGLDEGELDQCISQKLCDLVVTRWCGRNQNCWNQCSWFISDETKATPWFPWEGQSKTSGQGYNPPEHLFLRKDIYKQLLECITVFAQSWQRRGSHWQGIFWFAFLCCSWFPKMRFMARTIFTQIVGLKTKFPQRLCIQTLWKWSNTVQFAFVG